MLFTGQSLRSVVGSRSSSSSSLPQCPYVSTGKEKRVVCSAAPAREDQVNEPDLASIARSLWPCFYNKRWSVYAQRSLRLHICFSLMPLQAVAHFGEEGDAFAELVSLALQKEPALGGHTVATVKKSSSTAGQQQLWPSRVTFACVREVQIARLVTVQAAIPAQTLKLLLDIYSTSAERGEREKATLAAAEGRSGREVRRPHGPTPLFAFAHCMRGGAMSKYRRVLERSNRHSHHNATR